MIRRGWTLAATLAAAATMHAGAAQAAAPAAYGVQGIETHANAQTSTVASSIAAARRSGASLVRLEGFWAALQPDGPGRYDLAALAALDRAVTQARGAGLRVVLFVDRTPCWASSAPAAVRGRCTGPNANRPDVYRYPPADPQDYVPVSTFLAKRYGSLLAAFELWNEPDHSNEKYWAGPDKVKRYVALAKAVYGPLKAANPQMPVLVGSFVGGNGLWLKALYAAGIKGSYDGLAVHFYSLPLAALRTTRKTQRAAGDRTPLWLTEFGWTSCYRPGGPPIEIDQRCVSAKAQTQNVRDLLAGLRRMPWVRAAIQYELFDQPGGYHFGLFDEARRAKPVLGVVSRYLRRPALRAGRPTIAVARRGGRLVLGGHASGVEIFEVRVRQGSRLLLVASLRSGPTNRWQMRLPAAFGTTRGLRVTITGPSTGSDRART